MKQLNIAEMIDVRHAEVLRIAHSRSHQWSVPAMFLILPFMVILPGLIWRSHQLFFILMLLPILAFTIRNVWARCFFLYAAVWQLVVLWGALGNYRINPGPSLTTTTALIAGAFVFKMVSESKLASGKWFSVIRFAVIVQAAIAISQYLGFNPVTAVMGLFIKARELMPGHFVGTLGNKDFLTAFIAIPLPMFIGWRTLKWHIKKPFGVNGVYPWNLSFNLALFGILFILFFGPTPATLAAIIGMAVYFNRGWRSYAFGIIIACGMGYYYVGVQGVHLNEFQALPMQVSEFFRTGTVTQFINPAIPTDLGRFGMWLMALGKILHSWQSFVFGYGPAAFWGMPYPLHNEYMMVFFEFGFIGLALFLGYIVTTARFLFKTKRLLLASCFIIACLDMTGNYTLHIAPTAFLVVVIAGLIERERLTNG